MLNIIIVATLYIISIFTILATKYIPHYQFLLSQMSHENSFFESVGTIALFLIFFYGIYALKRYRFNRYKKITIVIFSILGFLAGMEEISWGQQIFHFPTSEYFAQHNIQDETNLHNLIDGNLFSSIVYSSVYTLLIFIPLIYKLSPMLHRFKLLRYFDIDPNIILVVLFGSTFQLYFYNDIGVIVDMITLFLALALFGLFLILKKTDRLVKIHFFIVVITMLISMLSHSIYSFYNMQYEIRESFIELASLFIFIQLIQKEKRD